MKRRPRTSGQLPEGEREGEDSVREAPRRVHIQQQARTTTRTRPPRSTDQHRNSVQPTNALRREPGSIAHGTAQSLPNSPVLHQGAASRRGGRAVNRPCGAATPAASLAGAVNQQRGRPPARREVLLPERRELMQLRRLSRFQAPAIDYAWPAAPVGTTNQRPPFSRQIVWLKWWHGFLNVVWEILWVRFNGLAKAYEANNDPHYESDRSRIEQAFPESPAASHLRLFDLSNKTCNLHRRSVANFLHLLGMEFNAAT